MNRTQSTSAPVQTQPSTSSFDITQAIEQHLPLVDKLARMAYRRFGGNFEHDDLVGYGHLGLVRAARKFAALEYDIRQAIDFVEWAKVRIWRNIVVGRDQMARVHRTHYRKIKRGEMAQPRFVRDGEDFSLADAVSTDAEELSLCMLKHSLTDEMIEWLRAQEPLWARVVDLHVRHNMQQADISKLIGRGPNAAGSIYFRAVNLIRSQYNPAAYRHDDRAGRKRKAQDAA